MTPMDRSDEGLGVAPGEEPAAAKARGELRAYSVQAYDYGCVCFAKSGAEARRKGAGEINLEWEDIVSCRRAPEFDRYAPGPVPDEALWKSGWTFLCRFCECAVGDDGLGQWIDGDACCEDCARLKASHPRPPPLVKAACPPNHPLIPPTGSIEGPMAENNEQRSVPDDVARLVVAARVVLYDLGYLDGRGGPEWEALDKATEAFADRVRWEGEPKAPSHA